MYETINFHLEGSTGILELNRPPANSMSKLFFHEIHELSDTILNDEQVKAIVVTGAGRHFSSGANISDLLSFDPQNSYYAKDFYIANSRTFKRFYTAKIPIIAAIKGVCLGSAMELAMSCHFRIATENVLMGFPESEYNLMTGCGGTYYLADVTNKKNVMDLLLGNKNLNASEALKQGVIDRVVKKNEILAKAINFAEKIKQDYNPKLRSFYIGKFLN